MGGIKKNRTLTCSSNLTVMQVLAVSFFREMGELVRVATPVLLVLTVHIGTPGAFRNCSHKKQDTDQVIRKKWYTD